MQKHPDNSTSTTNAQLSAATGLTTYDIIESLTDDARIDDKILYPQRFK
jgi:hypothetical protein